jgi:hypothetical protein
MSFRINSKVPYARDRADETRPNWAAAVEVMAVDGSNWNRGARRNGKDGCARRAFSAVEGASFMERQDIIIQRSEIRRSNLDATQL